MDREQLRTMVDSLRNKWKTAVVVLASVRGFQRRHRLRRHQGPHVEGPRRQAGRRGRAGRRRQRRRTSRHGGSRRQGSGRARRRAGRGLHDRRGDALTVEQFDAIVVGAGPTGLACGIELKQRGVSARAHRKGLRGELALQLPDPHGLLHHAGAARNRRPADDLAQRKARPHRGAEVLSPRRRILQPQHPSVRARAVASTATTATFTSPPARPNTARARSCSPPATTTCPTC